MKNLEYLKPYERANQLFIEKESLGLYFSSSQDKWTKAEHHSYEYKIDILYTENFESVITLVSKGYAKIAKVDDGIGKKVYLHMKRIY